MKKGTQACIDMSGCDRTKLNDLIFISDLITEAANKAEFRMLDLKMHQFVPYGVTGYALLSASHIAIHTWPEYDYASIDIFACDCRRKVDMAVSILIDGLKPKRYSKTILKRGYILNDNKENVGGE